MKFCKFEKCVFYLWTTSSGHNTKLIVYNPIEWSDCDFIMTIKQVFFHRHLAVVVDVVAAVVVVVFKDENFGLLRKGSHSK